MIYKILNKKLKTKPLDIYYDVQDTYVFTFDEAPSGGLYFAVSLKPGSEVLMLSENFTQIGDTVSFKIDTLTEAFYETVIHPFTKAAFEIGSLDDGAKKVFAQDECLVEPRIFVGGDAPTPGPSGETYATRSWTSANFEPIITSDRKLEWNLISGSPEITPVGSGNILFYQGNNFIGQINVNQALNAELHFAEGGGGGGITSGYVNEKITEHNQSSTAHSSLFLLKQDLITNAKKLSYSLLSGTPTIPTVYDPTISIEINGITSSFTLNQSSNKTLSFTVGGGGGGDATKAWVESNFEPIISADRKLSYSLLSGTPTIPTVNNATISLEINGITSSFTLNQASNKSISYTIDTGVTSSWVDERYQKIISNANKLSYSLLSGTPTIPTVNDTIISITQGGIPKGSFTLNQSTPATINLDAGGGSTPGSGIITIAQGGAIKGTFNVNQSTDQTINLDAGGGGAGDMLYNRIYSSDTILTAFHDCSYFWALQDQDATLYIEPPMLLQHSDYDIPIDINLSGSTVTLSGITRVGNFINGFLHRCLITKRYDKTLLYIYRVEDAYPMTQGLVGNWTTLGTDSSTYAGAAQVYTETTAGHYDSADGTYFIEVRGTNWRLFTSGDTEIAMGPLSSEPMQGEYGTVAMAPLAGDSVLTVKLENIIVPD